MESKTTAKEVTKKMVKMTDTGKIELTGEIEVAVRKEKGVSYKIGDEWLFAADFKKLPGLEKGDVAKITYVLAGKDNTLKSVESIVPTKLTGGRTEATVPAPYKQATIEDILADEMQLRRECWLAASDLLGHPPATDGEMSVFNGICMAVGRKIK